MKILIVYANRAQLRKGRTSLSGYNAEIVAIPIDNFNVEVALLTSPDLIIYSIGDVLPANLKKSVRELSRIDKEQKLFQVSIMGMENSNEAFFIPDMDVMIREVALDNTLASIFDNIISFMMYLQEQRNKPGISVKNIRVIRTRFRRIRNARFYNKTKPVQNTGINGVPVSEIETIMQSKFKVFLQPIFRAGDLKMICGEVLSRRVVQSGENQLPQYYIPSIQKDGQMPVFTFRLLESLGKKLRDFGIQALEKSLFLVNIPASVIFDRSFQTALLDLLAAEKIDHSLIAFEIYDFEEDIEINKHANPLALLKNAGIGYGFDGYQPQNNSIDKLASWQPLFIKFSRSVLRRLRKLPGAAEELTGMVQSVKAHAINVILNGVETAEDLVLAQSCDVDCVQGFFLSMPAEISVYVDFFKQNNLSYESSDKEKGIA